MCLRASVDRVVGGSLRNRGCLLAEEFTRTGLLHCRQVERHLLDVEHRQTFLLPFLRVRARYLFFSSLARVEHAVVAERAPFYRGVGVPVEVHEALLVRVDGEEALVVAARPFVYEEIHAVHADECVRPPELAGVYRVIGIARSQRTRVLDRSARLEYVNVLPLEIRGLSRIYDICGIDIGPAVRAFRDTGRV